MQYLGGLGIYYVRFSDQAPEYRDAFIRTLRAGSTFLSKSPRTPAETSSHFTSLVEALAELEVILPVFHNSMVIHMLLHIEHLIATFGAFYAHNMLDAERFHLLLKKFGKGTRNFLLTIANRYKLYCETEKWRLLPGTIHSSPFFFNSVFLQSGASTIKAPASSLAAPLQLHHGNLQTNLRATAGGPHVSARLPDGLFLQVSEYMCILIITDTLSGPGNVGSAVSQI